VRKLLVKIEVRI